MMGRWSRPETPPSVAGNLLGMGTNARPFI
nr:MAG TPA: hypothetical protein [Caudoviricetes sp.]